MNFRPWIARVEKRAPQCLRLAKYIRHRCSKEKTDVLSLVINDVMATIEKPGSTVYNQLNKLETLGFIRFLSDRKSGVSPLIEVIFTHNSLELPSPKMLDKPPVANSSLTAKSMGDGSNSSEDLPVGPAQRGLDEKL